MQRLHRQGAAEKRAPVGKFIAKVLKLLQARARLMIYSARRWRQTGFRARTATRQKRYVGFQGGGGGGGRKSKSTPQPSTRTWPAAKGRGRSCSSTRQTAVETKLCCVIMR
jgi:hypothetical protein